LLSLLAKVVPVAVDIFYAGEPLLKEVATALSAWDTLPHLSASAQTLV